jgi:DNA (cytosine-5)-methyltransferase 1
MAEGIKHLDIFSGIGGFAIAVDTVWPGSEHIFCDNDKFCQEVLKKHWPQSKIYGDIRALHADGFNTNSHSDECTNGKKEINATKTNEQTLDNPKKHYGKIDIITGGFPCQPFSQAGKRKGAADDRFLWPEMLRVIREFLPTWVVAENVRGITTQEHGVVFERVCADLENAGYEVQPIIIPACSVGAPHRRDRVWFIANRKSERERGCAGQECGIQKRKLEPEKSEGRSVRGESQGRAGEPDAINADRDKHRTGPRAIRKAESIPGVHRKAIRAGELARADGWERNWLEVATELCSVDDGLPVELGEIKLTAPGHRNAQLKAYGNAIVPQVAIEIMRAIKQTYE